MRQLVRYCIGAWPSARWKLRAKTALDSPLTAASSGTIHGWAAASWMACRAAFSLGSAEAWNQRGALPLVLKLVRVARSRRMSRSWARTVCGRANPNFPRLQPNPGFFVVNSRFFTLYGRTAPLGSPDEAGSCSSGRRDEQLPGVLRLTDCHLGVEAEHRGSVGAPARAGRASFGHCPETRPVSCQRDPAASRSAAWSACHSRSAPAAICAGCSAARRWRLGCLLRPVRAARRPREDCRPGPHRAEALAEDAAQAARQCR
jgi:hypothetical protein